MQWTDLISQSITASFVIVDKTNLLSLICFQTRLSKFVTPITDMKVKPDTESNGVAVVDLGYDLPEVKVTPDKVTEEEEEDPWALSDTVIHSTPWRSE